MPACAAPISAPDDRCRPLAESARAGSSTNPIPAASDTAANKSSGTPRAAIEPRTRACRPGGMRGRASGWSFLARLCRAHSLSSAAGSRPRGRCGYCNRGEPGVSRPIKAAVRRLPSASRDLACASSGRCSRPAGRDEAAERVANQESQATEKQPRAGCRPPGAIRLAHRPGDAVVPPGAMRLLSAWRTSS